MSRRVSLYAMVAIACRSGSPDGGKAAGSGAVTRPLRYWLPLDVGTLWVLEGEQGWVHVTVAGKEAFAGREALRVDWISDLGGKQSEFWVEGTDGVSLLGQRLKEQEVVFQVPMLLLKNPIGVGQTWVANVTVNRVMDGSAFSADGGPTSRTERIVIRVEAEERFRIFSKITETLRVHYAGEKYDYRRWFAKGLGLVQEEIIVPGRPTFTKKVHGLSAEVVENNSRE